MGWYSGQVNTLKETIKKDYDWDIPGDDWTLDELKTIHQTAKDIKDYVDGITGGKGQEWIFDTLGNARITHGNNYNEHSITWQTSEGPTIFLGRGWLNDGGWDSKQLFAHELGHVWDFNTLERASGQLQIDQGGSITCPHCLPSVTVPRWEETVNEGYGNDSVGEYFAEAFSWTVYDKTITPFGASTWIDNAIKIPSWVNRGN